MTCYFNSTEFYRQEIELAQRHGIDGFALNCGQWMLGPDAPSNYVHAAERLYEAARQMNSGFQLFFSVDTSGIGNYEGDVGDMVRRFADHPNQLRHNGRIVLSTYGGNAAAFAPVLAALKAEGREVFFVPDLSHPRWSANRSFESALRLLQAEAPVDGLFWFNPDATVAEILRGNATLGRACLFADRLYMAGISPSYNSPNLRDHYGIEGYAAVWEGIIRDGARWVEIVTWSDYNEDSNLMPYRWNGGREKQYYSHDETFLDATQYYAAWFRGGRPPAITQDKLYYAYRNRPAWLRRAWDAKANAWVDLTAVAWPFDQIHDDAEDAIYITTMLTAPAELTVSVAGATQRFAPPAGVAHVRVPLAAGVPHFRLQRGAAVLLDFVGRKRILDAASQTPQNSANGYHLLNRTWTGGDAAGPVIALSGKPARLAATGDAAAWSAPALATATYAVRVRYRNTGAEEARLTLSADGPPRADGEYPYYIPLFLPPAGPDPATVSLLWSLYDKTTALRIGKEDNPAFNPDDNHPLRHDHGEAEILGVELVKLSPVVAPPPAPALPNLIRIPGGTFTMGNDDGMPDEAPAHPVTVGAFAIGACEVTNAEYERFDPAHRQHRDGYSWRDHEPVIYVSWKDAAAYCNWLSGQHGLAPAMREIEEEAAGGGKVKRWVVDPLAEGFRLPTEAEWEYVASGRGEGRRYPWGGEAPQPGRHGHFAGAAALDADPRLPATFGMGVMAVGSFPAGASRDGVMDLAGNVAEWCADWLHPYPAEAQDNPCVQAESNYRAIRGGSWGYYGHSQRAADREYNNPNYPGYVYLGCRIAVSEAGYRKLQGASGRR